MDGNSQYTTPAPNHAPRRVEPQPYYVEHEFGGSAELTTTLVHALSDVTGADVTEAEFQLGNYVDTDALDRLFEPAADGKGRSNGFVGFNVWGHQVTIYHDGHIVISPPQAPPQGPTV